MRIATPIGFAAAAALVGASLAPAVSMIHPVKPMVSAPHHQMSVGTGVARLPIFQIRHGVIPSKKGAGSVYVSDAAFNVINGYALSGGSPTWTVSAGLSQPQGMASTKKNIYVANTNDSQILEYTPPSTSVTATISDPGFFPAGVAVNKKGSQVWVSNICSAPSCTQGNIAEFDGSGNPLQSIVCSNLYRYYFIAIDKKGNVAVDGEDASGFIHVDYITAGQSTCNTTTISVEFPGGLQFDTKGNLVVDDQDANTLTAWGGTGYGTLESTTDLGGGISDPVTFAFQKKDAQAWTANAGSADATAFAYPAGGSPTVTITSGLGEPIGVAVVPPGKAG